MTNCNHDGMVQSLRENGIDVTETSEFWLWLPVEEIDDEERRTGAALCVFTIGDLPPDVAKQVQKSVSDRVLMKFREFYGSLPDSTRMDAVLEAWRENNYFDLISAEVRQLEARGELSQAPGDILATSILECPELWSAMSERMHLKGEDAVEQLRSRLNAKKSECV